LSNGEFGGLYMLATLASAMTLPFLGRMVDRRSVAGTVLIVMPMLALAAALMAVSRQVGVLVLALYLLRLFGQGMMTHTSLTAMGRWFSGHRGRAVSLATLGHQTGEAVLPLAMVSLHALIGWRMSWGLFAALVMFLALPAIYLLMRIERLPQAADLPERRRAARHWTRREVLCDPLYWVMLVGTLAPGFIGTAIFFHQAYLLELRGWPPGAFASAFVLMACMTLTFALVSGWLIDRYGAFRLLPFFLLPLSLSCFSLAAIAEPVGIFVFMGLLGVSYGISSTLLGALWPEVYGTRHLGSVRSVTVAMMVFSSALGPGVTGWLIDRQVSYLLQLQVLGVYCLLAAMVMVFVSRQLAHRFQQPATAR
jgi:MFS family permease